MRVTPLLVVTLISVAGIVLSVLAVRRTRALQKQDRTAVVAGVSAAVARSLDADQIASDVADALCDEMRVASAWVVYRRGTQVCVAGPARRCSAESGSSLFDAPFEPGSYLASSQDNPPTVAEALTELDGCVLSYAKSDAGSDVAIVVGAKTDGSAYTPAETELLDIVAHECAAGIKNALLFEERNQRVRELSELNRLATAIANETDVQALLDRTLRQVITLTAADTGAIMLVEEGGEYLLIGAGAATGTSFSAIRTRVGEGAVGYVALHHAPIALPDPALPDLSPSPGVVSEILAPLVFQERLIGVMTLSRLHTLEPFTPENLSVLNAFAAQLAIALENARLYSDLEDTFLGTISALAAAVDAKDPYTFGHSNEVTEHSVAIAKRMGLDEASVRTIRIAAMLHDIGKIGIDKAILNKPDRLTDEEFSEIKRHPAIGADILAPLTFLKDAVPMILFHHERYGGDGYPSGIQGQAIPLGARIIQVADAFNAMVSDRPYRTGMPSADAIAELERCSGTQFDPQVVVAFISVLSDSHAVVRPEFVSLPGGRFAQRTGS